MPWDTVKLNDGNMMPTIACGTWGTGTGEMSVGLVKQAIAVGMHHIDTAQNYNNETEAGIAIRECGLPREQLFVTTKWSKLNDLDVADSFSNSLRNLGLEYIDLYLIHNNEICDDYIPRCWKEMEKIKDSGLARSIGVSNFEVDDLEQVFSMAKYIPAVNQIRVHPYIYAEQKPILDLCKQSGVVVQGYSPLIPVRVERRRGGPIDAPVISIAERLGVSMEQVLLAWARAKEIVPVTMSTKEERLRGYVKAGDLTLNQEDINSIDKAALAPV